MTAAQTGFDFVTPSTKAIGSSREVCCRCHLPLDFDRWVDVETFSVAAGMCDTCRREEYGEGVVRFKTGIIRWSGARLRRARRRADIDARVLGRWIGVAHTTIIRNERRERITAYLTRKLVAIPAYNLLAAVTKMSEGGAGDPSREARVTANLSIPIEAAPPQKEDDRP